MNTRLKQFLAAENISQAQFADTINVVRASVSHVLSGRNNPSYDFIKAIMLAYPDLDMEWLIFGKGKMYKETPAPANITTVQQTSEFMPDLFAAEEIRPVCQPKSDQSNSSAQVTQHTVKQRRIAKITILYDDGTYQELE